MTTPAGPHTRVNLLTGERILVSPHRMKRPWQGKTEETQPDTRPAHDLKCYLCPGNERAEGARNPEYAETFVFDNDFAALLPEELAPAAATASAGGEGMLVATPERGLCRVICFSPRHDLTLAEMDVPGIRRVVDVWVEQFQELGALDFIDYVQIFENKGALMGCSNPHPHGQVWASASLPTEPAKEDERQRVYAASHRGRTLLSDYLETELASGGRVVCRNDSWVCLVPFWAKWPYETMLIPVRPVARISDLDAAERDDLADILRRTTARYDNLFRVSFPYSMGFHQAPTNSADASHWHLHAHFYPPLLRSATVQKFMVGFEMLATPQRDITPEFAAERLRSLSEVHYKHQPRPAAASKG